MNKLNLPLNELEKLRDDDLQGLLTGEIIRQYIIEKDTKKNIINILKTRKERNKAR